MILFGMINKNQNFQVLLIVNWALPLERKFNLTIPKNY